MRVIIAGGRDFNDMEFLQKSFKKVFLRRYMVSSIISGGARGADKLGEAFAEKFQIPLVIIEAEWDKYGKSAGYRRNAEMAEVGDFLIAFWDGESRGTKHMIDIAKKKGIPLQVFNYHTGETNAAV